MRSLVIAAIAVATASVMPGSAHADGTSVGKWITTQQVVQKSKQILVCEVRKVDHQWRKARAYGRDHKYIGRYQVQVRVRSVLRGNKSLAGKTVWVERRGQSRPGKWVAIEEAYRSSFSLRAPKPGSRFIAYMRSRGVRSIVTSSSGKRRQLPLWQVDGIAKLKQVRALAKPARR